ncbi:hypothetical protein BJY01DRAFT_161905 [Aspergillus pseudoustus]|uniref:Uncharacterized protein n=1 Tax=Aspergillus pseudoustus TaxID=1810923 RepID=A0ABR4IBL2_9EURO
MIIRRTNDVDDQTFLILGWLPCLKSGSTATVLYFFDSYFIQHWVRPDLLSSSLLSLSKFPRCFFLPLHIVSPVGVCPLVWVGGVMLARCHLLVSCLIKDNVSC